MNFARRRLLTRKGAVVERQVADRWIEAQTAASPKKTLKTAIAGPIRSVLVGWDPQANESNFRRALVSGVESIWSSLCRASNLRS